MTMLAGGTDVLLPLSRAQEALWVASEMSPGSAAYNMAAAFLIEGPLDLSRLRDALIEVARRHRILSSVFVEEAGAMGRRELPGAPVELGVVDLTCPPASDGGIAAAQEEVERPFQLRTEIPFRAVLLRGDPTTSLLVIVLHHLVADAWSLDVICRDLGAAYAAVSGRESTRPPQYAAFVERERSGDHLASLERSRAYWATKLGGMPTTFELPSQHARPSVRDFSGATTAHSLPDDLVARVRRYARDARVSVATVLLAAYEAVLSRYTGQRDFAIGVPVACRAWPDVEECVGLFVNTVAVRARLDVAGSFAALTDRVRVDLLEALDHQDYPFAWVVRDLHLPRDPGREPLAQVSFNYVHPNRASLQIEGAAVRPVILPTRRAKDDFSLELVETSDALSCYLVYDRRLFERPFVDAFFGSFVVLLERAVADPATPTRDLPLLSDEDARRMVVDWNATGTAIPADAGVLARFEHRARTSPEAGAVLFEGRTLTYAELDRRANQLAHHLLARGATPGSLVAICVDRSPEMIVGLLGILKAGAAYVPLDPQYPPDRLAYLLADSRAPVAVVHAATRGKLPASAATVVCLDGDGAAIAREPAARVPGAPGLDDLAYCLYTSGSTGRPKGVLVTHRSLRSYVHAHLATCGIAPGDRVLQFSSIAFDVSVEEIFPTLAAGALLVLRPPDVVTPGEPFRVLVRSAAITILDLPTAFWHQWVQELASTGERLSPSVRLVIIGGEQVNAAHVARWTTLERPPASRWINMYGPTETTVSATAYEQRDARELLASDVVPIGRPIANTEVYVLDSDLRVVPVGVPGEIYIAGAGLARGYLNRPDLTAASFLPNPFGEPGSRMYRSGDRGRYRVDGNIEFLGRTDHQVKLRGFRIELGEIENALCACEEVRDAVVAMEEDATGDARLVAYVAPTNAAAFAPAELRAKLLGTIPKYMVPSSFVVLESLPLNANGKVDRAALPALGSRREHWESPYSAPRTATEDLLAGIWADVLKLDRVGAHDDFFELGGHSLLATQVLARVRRTFGQDLPVQALFEAPSPAEFSLRLHPAQSSHDGASRPIQALPRTGEMPLSFAQERLWFLEHLEPGSPLYNMGTAFRLRGHLDVGALERSVAEIVRRHEVLRSTFATQGGRPVQAFGDVPVPSVAKVDLSDGDERGREARLHAELRRSAATPFDLTRGPLFRATLFQLGPEEHALLLSMHHVVADAWSMGVLARELSATYAAFAQGLPSPLGTLRIQYSDFARWQRGWMEGSVLERQLDYWKEKLQAPRAMLAVPLDRQRPPEPTFVGAQHRFALGAELTRELRRVGREHGATMFMVLLSGFKALLHRYTGETDVIVGTAIAGRNRPEVEPLIGFFVNTLALRSSVAPSDSFADLLRRVRQSALDAYANQDVPFEKVVAAVQPARDLQHSPLFQVMFSLENTPAGEFCLPGLTMEGIDAGTATAKFDLSVEMREAGGEIVCTIEYGSDLFERSTIEQLARHLETLLRSAASDPGQAISALAMMGDEERSQVTRGWNATERPYPRDATVHGLFSEQARKTPSATALIDGTERLSYDEVDRRSESLASWLGTFGLGGESPVAVCLPRSVDTVVALLGILKAGCAYVPIHPDQPLVRTAHILEEVGAKVLLADSSVAPRMRVPGVRTEVIPGREARLDARTRTGEVRPENLAYVMFTSGSTGKPKGVGVTHRNIIRLVRNAGYARFGPEEVGLHLASLAFDASTFEIWGSLLNGGTLAIAPGDPLGFDDIASALRGHEVTTVLLTTALFQGMVNYQVEGLRRVRRLLTGGDVLSVTHARTFLRELPDCELINAYGPTEGATITCCHTVTQDDVRRPSIPIGRPIGNATTHILDRNLDPVPIRVTGELYIGGDGVARGYVGQPAMTAERFIPDPFASRAGARLYKTGDLCRFRADGTVEFLGRADTQVKLRGFRIELGEIEAALQQCDGVRDAAVLANEHAAGDKHLTAYVVAKSTPPPSARALKTHLRTLLPEYMVPATIVFLESLPSNANGKLDRRLLQARDPAPSSPGRSRGARTATEKVVEEVWSEVLKLQEVDVDDNFFDLGGNSLQAAQVVARIAARISRTVHVRDLFRHQTVASLAEAIDGMGDSGANDSLRISPIPRAPRRVLE